MLLIQELTFDVALIGSAGCLKLIVILYPRENLASEESYHRDLWLLYMKVQGTFDFLLLQLQEGANETTPFPEPPSQVQVYGELKAAPSDDLDGQGHPHDGIHGYEGQDSGAGAG